jgi:hypothetical protein
VISATQPSSSEAIRYVALVAQPADASGTRIAFSTDQRLTVGEQARLVRGNQSTSNDEWEPVLASPDRYLSVGLFVAGMMLLSSAAKQRAWSRGNEQLRDIVANLPSDSTTRIR